MSITFVSGPRRSGKSAVIRAMIDHLWKRKPHYLRLVPVGSDKRQPQPTKQTANDCGVASARWLNYDPQHAVAVLQDTFTAIHKDDRYGAVVIEADADPSLRCAYPYDHRVFVMPMPRHVREVFRDPRDAANELKRVMDDTSAFASEMYGLVDDASMRDPGPRDQRPSMTSRQWSWLLGSPLGLELATKIALQPAYHGLVESEVVVINSGIEAGDETEECMRRIHALLRKAPRCNPGPAPVFICNPTEPAANGGRELLKALKPMCRGGK